MARFGTVALGTLKAAAIIVVLLSIGCGKRRPPSPPKERVQQRAELAGFQRGNEITLSWKMPLRNAGPDNSLHISRIDVYRLVEPVNSPTQLSEEEFANRSSLITVIPVSNSDFGGKTLLFKDLIDITTQVSRFRYSIRFVNASGQKAAFSNVILMEPASKIATSPTSLEIEATQDKLSLTWTAPASNIDGSTPASILGYNVYRSTSADQPAKLLNNSLITATSFDDEFFEFGKEHFYFIRAVSAGVQSEPVESVESNIVRITPIDTFAPSAPSAITVAAAPGTISIFFAINPEKDIAGYKIYRSTDPDLDLKDWTLLTPELSKANTFQDQKVEAGTRYFYYITATDTAGNVSEPSEIVSETAP